MGKCINIDDMRKIAYELFEVEKVKFGCDVNIFPLTFNRYFFNYLLNINCSFEKRLFYFIIPFISGVDGYFDSLGNIVIFLNKFSGFGKRDSDFIDFLETCYHEFRHCQQLNFDSFKYDGFLIDMESFIKKYDGCNYFFNHNSYSYEIGANLYGIRMARDYVIRNYPMMYEKNRKLIDKKEIVYEIDYYNYDAVSVFEKFVFSLRKSNYCGLISDISPVLSVFMNDDYSFRNFNSIMKDDRFKELDERICSLIISSNVFLESICMDSLGKNELCLLRYYINYCKEINCNRKVMINNLLNKLDGKVLKRVVVN